LVLTGGFLKMVDDQREQAVSLTRVMFRLPSYKRTLVYLFISCFAAGILMRLALNGVSLSGALVFGGAEGVLLLAFPAVTAAVLATGAASRKNFKMRFKYFMFIAFACALLTAVVYIAGLFANAKAGLGFVYEIVLIANALTVLGWFIGTFLVLNIRLAKALPISFSQAFLNVAFIYLWTRFGMIESSIAVGSPVLAAIKIVFASLILLFALWAVFFIINAPSKRNFGVSTVHVAAMFFAQWIGGSKEFESVMAELGSPAETLVGGVVFESKKGVKSVFAVPCVHYGPVGNLGGSEFPALISKELDDRLGCTTLVFHSTVTHDFNPVHSFSHREFSKLFEQEALRKQAGGKTLSFDLKHEGASSVFSLGFGDKAFLALTRAPKSTEDIDLALGMALRNRALASGWKDATIVDEHNSLTTGRVFGTGSREYFDFENAVSKVFPSKGSAFGMGVAKSATSFSLREGIGAAGVRCAVFKNASKTACLVLVDGNNMLPDFRDELLRSLKKFGFGYAEVFTTDSHSVNNISGVHNPVGLNCDRRKLIQEIEACVRSAIGDVEPCSARVFSRRIAVHVLGANRQSQLTSTINSVVAVLKIIAPAVFIASMLLALAVLVFLR